jgi:RNA polymerase sigma factor (sigma-70 family)
LVAKNCNKSIDFLRREKIQITDRIDEKDFPESNKDYNEIDNGKTEILIDEIKKQINELPDGYRIIFSLFYIEGYDHEEIGQILNITQSTSRSQLARAKERLVKQMNKLNFTR